MINDQLITTTNEIRKHHPCGILPDDTTGLRKLLNYLGKETTDDEPINIMTVLKSNGIEDAIWCLRCFEFSQYNQFVADVAESVLHIFEKEYPNDERPRKAIEACRNMPGAASADAAYADTASADAAYAAYDAYAAAAAAYAASAADATYAAYYAASADAAAADAAAAAADATYAAHYAASADAASADAAAAAAADDAAYAAKKRQWEKTEELFIKHFG